MELITPILAVMCVVLVVLLWREAWGRTPASSPQRSNHQGRRIRIKPCVVGQCYDRLGWRRLRSQRQLLQARAVKRQVARKELGLTTLLRQSESDPAPFRDWLPMRLSTDIGRGPLPCFVKHGGAGPAFILGLRLAKDTSSWTFKRTGITRGAW